MITQINIKETATIQDIEIKPNKINYIFGGNGTGKTTISRFINDERNRVNGNIKEDNGDCEILVYNKDFIDSNFNNTSSIHGIFTIGESAVDAEKFIKEKNEENNGLQKEIERLENESNKLGKEYNTYKEEFINGCWNLEKKIGNTFSDALTGYRNSKINFSNKCANAYKGVEININQEELELKYKQLYKQEKNEYDLINEVTTNIIEIEKDEIFLKVLVKREDSYFSMQIDKMGNLNWISQGINYIGEEKKCPFCQQLLNEEIIAQLNGIFDETYIKSLEKIKEYKETYNQESQELQNSILKIIDSLKNINFINTSILEEKLELLKKINKKNNERINEKSLNPCNKVEMIFSKQVVNDINKEIDNINKQIVENNKIVKNLREERILFNNELWDYISNNQLFSIIKNFNNKKKDYERENQILNGQIQEKMKSKGKNEDDIREKQKNIVNIDNAINQINKILKNFGFNNFRIKKKDDLNYCIIRPDGKEVKNSLSEGESRFITFLYFYQLVDGLKGKTDINKDKIIVIDDPISSLDSNILFIVSYLVNTLIKRCKDARGINQIFILTHNGYFFNEVTYKRNQDKKDKNKTYFVLKKVNEITQIVQYETNPIKTSYTLLWDQIKDTSIDVSLMCNVMRRILENYLSFICNKSYRDIIEEFEGEDLIICKSLFLYMNFGSHNIYDDFNLVPDQSMSDKYREVFKRIFEKTGQIDHYNRMMQ